MSFPKINPKQNFPLLETEILKFWQKEKVFQESVSREAPAGEFKFFDGPPFATGLPHYGHILQGVIKDLIPRYKTMRGYRVERRWGWDCHGLPVENLIETELGLKDKKAIEEYGVAKFNEACRNSVLKFAKEWQSTVERMGRWVDFENSYKTMDLDFMDSVWRVFGELWKKGLIYEGLKPMHVCPRCTTPLSNFEVGQGYRDVTDLSCVAKFKLENEPNTYLLAWTTTPWTLPGNVALAVGKDIEYVKVKVQISKYKDGSVHFGNPDRNTLNEIKQNQNFKAQEKPQHIKYEEYIFSKNAKEIWLKMFGFSTFAEVDLDKNMLGCKIELIKAKELIGKTYEPLFPEMSDEKNSDPHEVIPGYYFITFNTDNNLPIFTNEKIRIAVADAFAETAQKNNYKIYELAVIPNHVHLVVEIEEGGHSLPKVLQQLKGGSSWQLKKLILKNYDAVVGVNPTLKRGVNTNGQSATYTNNVLKTSYHDRNGKPYIKLWRRGYDKKFIFNENDYCRIADYIQQNPTRAGLPTQTYDWLQIFDDNNKPIDFPQPPKSKSAFKVVPADFVTTNDGTGIVHIAPAFGEDDLNLAKKENLPTIQHVDMAGKISDECEELTGLSVKPSKNPRATDEKICELLEARGLLFEKKNYRHSYPHCWRCDSPLINYATKSWFVAVEKIKKQLCDGNEKINWIPAHIKHGRFGKWLENARDWAISRNRFWGTPLPVWRCENCGETKCVSSHSELEKLSGKKVSDLHKHFVDEIYLDCKKCSQKMQRVPEVLDCWFESGSMPYLESNVKNSEGRAEVPSSTFSIRSNEMNRLVARSTQDESFSSRQNFLHTEVNKSFTKNQLLKNSIKSSKSKTADFIAEAQDQTRGWFYTLHILSMALQSKPAFKNVICSGLILAEDGAKMSKSKRNFPAPEKIFNNFGADAMRLYLMNSPVVAANDLRFVERGVAEIQRSVLLPLWNTFYFFTTYANADNWILDNKAQGKKLKLENSLDKWILSELNKLIRDMTIALDNFEINAAVKLLPEFLDGLTNWYVRRSRRRFWKSDKSDEDKQEAYQTLFTVLTEVSKLLAPVCPFLAEKIYRDLTGERSVHLEEWPDADESLIDEKLSNEISIVRKIISLGLKIRATQKIKVRQPLVCATIALSSDSMKLNKDDQKTICDELNIKKIEFTKNPNDLAEQILSVNARIVGKKFGSKVQEIIKSAKAGKFEILDNDQVKVCGEILAGEEFNFGWQGKSGLAVESDAGVVVALDVEISDELKLEGKAREINRVVQDLRKEADFEVSDKIILMLENADDILANTELKNYLTTESLAEQIITKIENADVDGEIGNVRVGVRIAKN
jgi:isoleucyl-tRNA synthetase